MGGLRSQRTRRTALCGIMAGCSAALICLAGVLPSGRLGVTALAGLFPAMAVVSAGRAAGLLCWAAGGLLGLLVGQEKWLGLLYLVFLGLYPVVKSVLECLRRRWAEWLGKLLYFNAALLLFWTALRSMFLPALPAFLQSTPAVLFVGNAVFLAYDIGLSRLIAVYSRRIAPALGLR